MILHGAGTAAKVAGERLKSVARIPTSESRSHACIAALRTDYTYCFSANRFRIHNALTFDVPVLEQFSKSRGRFWLAGAMD